MKMHIGLIIILSMATNAYGVDSIMFTKTKKSYVQTYLAPDTVDYIPKIAPEMNSSDIRCSYAPMQMITKTWVDNNKQIFTDLNCDKSGLKGVRFTNSSCAMAIACSKGLLDNEESKLVIDAELNDVLAKDYAKNSLDESLGKVERFEVLRAFAKEKKYALAEDQKNCPSKIDIEEGGKCNLKMLDEVFVEKQANCRFGKLCYQDEDTGKSVTLGFRNFKKKEKNPAESYLLDYQKYRVANKGKSAIQDDSEYVDNLSTFVASDEFKKANSDKKAEMFLEYLKKQSMIDPVLGFELDSSAFNVDKESFLKLKQFVGLYENKKLTKESFARDFENYRKEHAQAILSGSGSCSDVLSINKICKETTALSLGGIIGKHPTSIEKLSSLSMDNGASVAKIKSSLGGKFNEKYFDSLLNAQRCIAFDLVNQNEVNSNGTFYIKQVGDKRNYRDDTKDDLEVSPRATASKSSSGLSGWGDEKMAGANGAAAIKEGMNTSDEAVSSSKIAPPIASVDQGFQNNFANSYADNFRQTPAPEKEKAPEIINAPVIPANASNDDKINDLMKRLAAAEEKVDKMKASNEEAENERAKQKKIDEEDALVKDLKNQITDLKNTKKATVKPAIADVQSNDSIRNSNSSNNFSIAPSNRVESASKVIPTSDNYVSSRNDGGSISSVIGAASRSAPSSVAAVALTANTSGDKAGSGPSVLTVDGMTSEKASETIFNRIIELKGVPFYIEESGMMKEIVPVMKDGKIVLDEKGNPVFEKIVKGRAGDKKFAKIKDKKRAPASITNVADLKRDEEDKLKVERVEYMKLKELTKGILDSNQ